MLTIDILKANIQGLTDEQYNDIAKLSENDENAVIANKTRDHWDGIDKDILEVTGKSKPSDKKSYDFLKEVLSDFKTKTGSLKSLNDKVQALETEKTELEGKLSKGDFNGVAAVKIADLEKALNDKVSMIEKLRADIETARADFEGKLNEERSRVTDLKFDTEFAEALRGVKFKSVIPQDILEKSIQSAKNAVKAKGKAEFEKDATGVEKVIFRDDKDLIITNPANKQMPLTIKDILLDELKSAIDVGKEGAGGGAGKDTGGRNATVDLSGAKTKTEANDLIRSQLAAEGLVAGSGEWTDRQKALYEENNVAQLPIS